MQVFQLAGKVGEKAAYHHGDASLNSTIVGLAQNFVGSNNINLLDPSGAPLPRSVVCGWVKAYLQISLCSAPCHAASAHANRRSLFRCCISIPIFQFKFQQWYEDWRVCVHGCGGAVQASSGRACRAARTPAAPVTSTPNWPT